MSYRIVAFHHPKAEFRDQLLERLFRAAETMEAAPGCIGVEVWQEQTSGALVSTARFDSRESCWSALRTTAQTTDIQFDEREDRAREIYDLVEPA
jgi:heme-degrading monooxygenase HmoA